MTADPPPVHEQVTALRIAFPAYRVSMLSRRGDKPRIEAVSLDGGDPYCLISDSAAEIWAELKKALPVPFLTMAIAPA